MAPLFKLAACLIRDPLADRNNQPILFRARNEVARHDHAVLVADPAYEGFRASGMSERINLYTW